MSAVQPTLIPPNMSRLADCVEDVRLAAGDTDPGPVDPLQYAALIERLEAARQELPPLYIDALFEPYLAALQRLGQAGFTNILTRDPKREGLARIMLDIAQAVLQNGEEFAKRAGEGFSEIVGDLYDGFLSAEDRRGVEPPDESVVAPMVKFGRPEVGPYTLPVDATSVFGVHCGILNLPPANARRGLLAWAALGHETAGHDILHADAGLRREAADAVEAALTRASVSPDLPGYWVERIDEAASDVLGVLNMGPAAGVALVGYFRGLNAAFTGVAKLRSEGPADDPHPADVLRGFLAAAAVRLLTFSSAPAWSKAIDTETQNDANNITIAGNPISLQDAHVSAEIVARSIILTRMRGLENRTLGSIQNWRNGDEATVARLRRSLASGEPVERLGNGVYAAHVVAAALTATVAGLATVEVIFGRMLAMLQSMHEVNPSWSPLPVRHPGSLAVHRAYIYPGP
ncbi:MAG: hypothetical protein ACRD8O_15375 [Bryobacteraceae bacterium]